MDEVTKRRDAIAAVRLFEQAHTAIDGAISSNATLIAGTLDIRGRHISGVSGQAELLGMLAGLQTLAEARQQLIDAHHATSALGHQCGLRVSAEGGLYPKPAPPLLLTDEEEQRTAA